MTTTRREPLLLGLMLALTFSTGVIDAVGYLGLDRVFTGNMTGNVVILGMAVAGADDLPIAGPLLALGGFLAGAALGGRALRGRASTGWDGRITVLFGLVAAVLFAVSGVLLADEHPAHGPALALTTALGAAMGLQAAVARFIAVKDVTTVVVTSTITGLAADSVLGGGKPGHANRRMAAIALITTGAGVGALALQVHLGLGVLIAAALTAAVTATGHLLHRPAR
ncbi:MAG: YoaK family protein [Aeromicrobium sp.]|uniref:YoaK family protein n=1 Tax=Aeromicrobium sp. TaxID=1871063 RepID=UPI0039E5A420